MKIIKCRKCGNGNLFYFRGDEKWGVLCRCGSEISSTAFRATLKWNLKHIVNARVK